MLNRITNTKLLFFLAIIIGSIGAIGQAYMLHHELVDCYPYKMMDWNFYKSIAGVGVYFAPIAAVIVGILFGLKRFWLTIIVPVVLCPLLFSTVFKIFSIMQKFENINWQFDGQTTAMAAQEFFLYTLALSFVGLIMGAICSFILYRLSIAKKLP